MKVLLAFARNGCLHIFLAVLGGMCICRSSSAALVLTIVQNGGSPITVNDNGSLDTNSSPETINWQEFSTGGLTISVVTGVSNNPGNATVGSLSQTQVDITNSSLSTVTLVATLDDTNFTNPLGTRSLLSNITATFTGVITGNSASLLSTANSTSTLLQTLTSSGSDSKTVAFPDAGAYSLENQTSVSLAAGATVVISDTTSVVPEPAAVSVLALAIAGLMTARRRTGLLKG